MMDLVPGHYPRPRWIVDFKVYAIDGRSFSSSWFKTKPITATEHDLLIATNWHSLTAQPRWFRCDEATIRLYLPERVEKNCRNERCRRWWYCRRLVGNNKNNEDSIWLVWRQIRNSFWSWFPAMQENSVDPENPEAVANKNFTDSSFSWTDQNTNIVFYERPISHFHIQ